MNALRPLWLALAFLTRLPVPPLGHVSARELGASLPWFPAVGLILGAALALAAALGPEQPLAGAAWVLILWVALSGNLHLDGLADTLDALAGGRDPAARLALMKDPRAGPAAVSGVALVLIAKFAALAACLEAGAWAALWWVPVLGRAALVGTFLTLPYLRPEGLGRAYAEHLSRPAAHAALALAALGTVAFGGLPGLAAVAAAALVFAASVRLWRARLGGLTGDAAGATLEVVETAALLAWVWAL